MRKTSYLALVAAAGLFGATIAPATAADLGGGCCADLEERVAELEATTARKGNRVVSLQVYGQVNKALMYFDNGDDSDTYVVDNDSSTSRLGFKGSAKIKPGWSAGYNMEFDLQADSNSNRVTVDDDEGGGLELRIRQNYVYVESEQLGRLSIGQGDSASNGTSEVVLANSLSDSSLGMGGKITIEGAALDSVVDNLDGVSRVDRVRYDSPSVYGFVLSASWGEDDYYDVALRFKKEWNSIRIAAAAGYASADELPPENLGASPIGKFDQISGSISVMHVPTGIYGAFDAGTREYDDGKENEPEFFYAQAGIEKRFFSYGATTLYAEYGQYEEVLNTESKVDRWGIGFVQAFDSAALEIYGKAQFFDVDKGTTSELFPDQEGDLTLLMLGSRIKF
jgi:predicted porin